jgi:hypothetical protein
LVVSLTSKLGKSPRFRSPGKNHLQGWPSPCLDAIKQCWKSPNVKMMFLSYNRL